MPPNCKNFILKACYTEKIIHLLKGFNHSIKEQKLNPMINLQALKSE